MGRVLHNTMQQITLPYCCAAVMLQKDNKGTIRVVDAAPIYRWMIGKAWADITPWVRRKRGSICGIPYEVQEDRDGETP